MCSILGFADFNNKIGIKGEDLADMGKSMSHRGPDQNGLFMDGNVCFQHNRLAVIDVEMGLQPMQAVFKGCRYTIVYNGEIYNADELRRELIQQGAVFTTRCDTEVVLYSYIMWGRQCSEKLNGIYAFAVYDEARKLVYLSRDRMGVKPLFFTVIKGTLAFASEIKGLLQYPDIKPELEPEGLWQLLFLSPMRPADSGIFKNIRELPPAHHAVYDRTGLRISPYWTLTARELSEDEDTILEKTGALVSDAVKRQLVSDVPLCTFLSGGLDSSVITAIAKNCINDSEPFSTYSFEYEGNKRHFTSTLFQPQSDDEYAVFLSEWLKTEHTVLTMPTQEITSLLCDAVIYRDFPGMADIDSSLLYYCREVKKRHTVALSGECSDEVFGGYPWFYRHEMLDRPFFPWIHDPFRRISLFDRDVADPEKGYEYARQIYSDSVNSCPGLGSDSPDMKTSRLSTWLSVNWFMASLLERKDRMSMASGLEVRVPFADHRILEYVYNIPWEIKYKNGVEKALLRNSLGSLLPDRIMNRKKSPYPKTRNPQYYESTMALLQERLQRPNSMLRHLLCRNALEKLHGMDDGTWFGQLMGTAQLAAWLVQLDFWFERYRVSLV